MRKRKRKYKRKANDKSNNDYPVVTLSKSDKASLLKLEEDLLTVTGEAGYRSIRATQSAHAGLWFYEVKILDVSSSDGHLRLGWAPRKANVEFPVGYDDFSFGMRDIDGAKINGALRQRYGQKFGQGDVIGCLLRLPPALGADDMATTKVAATTEVRFFLNGRDLGSAYRGFASEPLYPMISLFRNISVKANFGPDFHHPPKLDEKVNAMAYAAAPASVFSTVEQQSDLTAKKKKVEPLLNNKNINVELMAQHYDRN